MSRSAASTDASLAQQVELLQLLIEGGGVSEAHLRWFLSLTPEQRDSFAGVDPASTILPMEPNTWTRSILRGARLVLPPTDGERTFVKARDVFPWHLDGDFHNWGTDASSKSTTESLIDVREIIQDGTFPEIFGSISADLERLCLTQDQIITFCLRYRNWLRGDGYSTFFLFKSSEQPFIADVSVRFSQLQALVHPFWRGDRVYGIHLKRLVVPKH